MGRKTVWGKWGVLFTGHWNHSPSKFQGHLTNHLAWCLKVQPNYPLLFYRQELIISRRHWTYFWVFARVSLIYPGPRQLPSLSLSFSKHCFLSILLCPKKLWAEMGLWLFTIYTEVYCLVSTVLFNTCLPHPPPTPKPRRWWFQQLHLIQSLSNSPMATVAECKFKFRFDSRICAPCDHLPDFTVDMKYIIDPNLTSRDPGNQVCTSKKRCPAEKKPQQVFMVANTPLPQGFLCDLPHCLVWTTHFGT